MSSLLQGYRIFFHNITLLRVEQMKQTNFRWRKTREYEKFKVILDQRKTQHYITNIPLLLLIFASMLIIANTWHGFCLCLREQSCLLDPPTMIGVVAVASSLVYIVISQSVCLTYRETLTVRSSSARQGTLPQDTRLVNFVTRTS